MTNTITIVSVDPPDRITPRTKAQQAAFQEFGELEFDPYDVDIPSDIVFIKHYISTHLEDMRVCGGDLTQEDYDFLVSTWKDFRSDPKLFIKELLAEERQWLCNEFGITADADAVLARELAHASKFALDAAAIQEQSCVYFKVWKTQDFAWYKIGVTTDATRRDKEQNVLPVPATTIALLRLPTFFAARSVELAMHKLLEPYRITGANNKEIFTLDPPQVSAIIAAMKKLGDCEVI